MTERLADITARIDGIRQLGAVVNAMRGIAAARAQQARSQLAAVDGYAATIAAGIGRTRLAAAAATARAPGDRAARPALVLFCAEQGFAGAFSERIFDAAGGDLAKSRTFPGRHARRGSRSRTAHYYPLAERHAVSLARHSEARRPHRRGALCADRGGRDRPARRHFQPVGDRARIDTSNAAYVSSRSIWQLFPPADTEDAPLLELPPDRLLRDLTADYIHAQLCHAALHAFAAENEARMEAMAAARRQIDRQLTSLQATQRRVRQDEITAEIIELAAGETALASRA